MKRRRTQIPAASILALAIVSLLVGCGAGGADPLDGGGEGDGGGGDEFTYVSDGAVLTREAVSDFLTPLGLQGKWRQDPFVAFIDTYVWFVPDPGVHDGRYSHDQGFDVFSGDISWVDLGRVGPYPAAILWTNYGFYDSPEIIVITSPTSYIHEIGNAGDRYQKTYIPD